MNTHWSSPHHQRFLREAEHKFEAGGTYNRRPGRNARAQAKRWLRQTAHDMSGRRAA